MPKHPPSLLTDIPAFRDDETDLNVIIETPKGSRNKLDYEPDLGFLSWLVFCRRDLSFPMILALFHPL